VAAIRQFEAAMRDESTDQAPFRVSAEEKRLLLESIAHADRGEFVDGEELLAELDESN